jgi:hypothetical protein
VRVPSEVLRREAMIARVVAARLAQRHAVRPVAHEDAEVVRHHVAVGSAEDDAGRRDHARHEPTLLVVRWHVDRLDDRGLAHEARDVPWPIIEADPGQRLAVLVAALSANRVRDAGRCHQVALVGRVHEHPAFKAGAVGHDDVHDPAVVHGDPSERLLQSDRHGRLREHLVEHLLGDARFPVEQWLSLAVGRANTPIELECEAAEGRGVHVLELGGRQTARAHAADVPGVLQYDDRGASARGRDRRDDAARRPAVDDDVEPHRRHRAPRPRRARRPWSRSVQRSPCCCETAMTVKA